MLREWRPGAFDDDRRDTFMTRSPVLVRFYRSTGSTVSPVLPFHH